MVNADTITHGDGVGARRTADLRAIPGSVDGTPTETLMPLAHRLAPGQRIKVAGVGRVEILETTQRNWSLVATARCGDERVFVKQFVDRIGRPHRRGFSGDQRAIDQLGHAVVPGLQVVPVIGQRNDLLLSVSPFVEMTTIDSIGWVRRRHADPATCVGEALAEILRRRVVEDQPDHVNIWKGLDPKNIGWDDRGGMYVFDFGPPKVVTTEVAAARALAAGLLCRWVARPGRHLVSPERVILRGVSEPLVPFTTLAAVEQVLDQHKELRLREPQRTGIAATATRIGLHTLGSHYWSVARREARRMFRST